MKIKEGFMLKQVCEEFMVVPVGAASVDFKSVIRLNETGAFLWKLMAEKDCTEEELVEALLAEYDVAREIAANDVHRIVEQLRESNIFV